MTKEEVLALGVPEDKYRAFQMAYNADLNKRIEQKRETDDADWLTRNAITAMVKLIKKPESLKCILDYINKTYWKGEVECQLKSR